MANPFLLTTSDIYLSNLNFKLINLNKKDSISLHIKNAGGSLSDFKILGPEVSAKIRGLYFNENSGVEVTNLTTDFTYSKTAMLLKETTIETTNMKQGLGTGKLFSNNISSPYVIKEGQLKYSTENNWDLSLFDHQKKLLL